MKTLRKYLLIAIAISTFITVTAQELPQDSLKTGTSETYDIPHPSGNQMLPSNSSVGFNTHIDQPSDKSSVTLTVSPEAYRIPVYNPLSIYGPFSPYNFYSQNFTEGLIMKGILANSV